jgi:broad specificity phosphatase PhoE
MELASSASADVLRLGASGVLPKLATSVWVSSAERKAIQTAELLTSNDISVVDDLHETRRTWQPEPQGFAAIIERGFLDPLVNHAPGWEPFAAATERLPRATCRTVKAADRGDVVMVSHGTAWTLLASALTALVAPGLDTWRSMTLPDHCSIHLEHAAVASRWGAWRLDSDHRTSARSRNAGVNGI